MILAYQEAPGAALRHGALLITAAPTEAWVSDDMAGPLPEVPAAFRHIARSCFIQQDHAIPILDARQLFARALPGAPATDDTDVAAAADELRFVESTCARRLEPVADEAPRGAAGALDMPVWRTAPSAPPAPVRADVPDASGAGRDPAAPVHGVVIPFMPGRPADASIAASDSASAAEAGAAPDDTATAATADGAVAPAAGPADGTWPGETNTDTHPGATPRVERPRPPSNTLQSYQRLRAMERAGQRPERRLRYWGLLLAVLAVAILALVVYLPARLSVSTPSAAPPAARDVAPGDIHPASVPSAPAQPPR